jgi:LPXTG-motif cell wall-anchored protein
MMPRNVVRFEQLIYASLVVRLIIAIVDFARLSKVTSALAIVGAGVAGFVILVLLAWLIARRRKNWARWVLLTLYLLGLPFVIVGPFVTEVGGVALAKPSPFVISLIALETIAQAVALIFVFTGDAKAWFARGVPMARLLEVEMPRSIAHFELLAYLGLLVDMISTPFESVVAIRDPSASTGAKIGTVVGGIIGIVILGLLIWLIARRRKNWARWLFLVLYGIGLVFFVFTLGHSGRLIDGLNALQGVLWAVALYFAFSTDAHAWFNAAPGEPLARSVRPRPRLRVPGGRREVVAPGELDHTATVDAYIAEMEQLGVSTYTAAPPFFRMLWGMGLRLPPPLFMGFAPLMLITGAIFAVFWGAGMWLVSWRMQGDMPMWLTFAVSIFAGLLFGLAMAAYYRSKSRSLPLPSWQNYLPPR